MAELTELGTATLAVGGDLDLINDSQRDFLPETDMSEYLDRFDEAVTRSRMWRLVRLASLDEIGLRPGVGHVYCPPRLPTIDFQKSQPRFQRYRHD